MECSMKKIIVAMLIVMFSLSLVSGLDKMVEATQGESYRVKQVCADANYINISSITYPNSSIAVSNIAMNSLGSGEYYYSFTSTSVLGRYDVTGISDGCDETFATYFIVTENGNEAAGAGITIVFSLLFFMILSYMLITLVLNIGHLAEVDTDLKDVVFSLIGYFGLLCYYYFANIYFPKEFIMEMLPILLSVGGFTHLFLPPVSLIFSTIKRGKIE